MLLLQEWATKSAWVSRAMTSRADRAGGKWKWVSVSGRPASWMNGRLGWADPVSMAFKQRPKRLLDQHHHHRRRRCCCCRCVCAIFVAYFAACGMQVEWDVEWASISKLSICVCMCVCVSTMAQVYLKVNYLSTRLIHPSSLTATRCGAHNYATLLLRASNDD